MKQKLMIQKETRGGGGMNAKNGVKQGGTLP